MVTLWEGGRLETKESQIKFWDAFLNSGFVARESPSSALLEFPGYIEIALQRNSIRVTSKPRDFVLAIMPQYGFYAVPKDPRKMTFGQLFLDCYNQLETALNKKGRKRVREWEHTALLGVVGLRTGKVIGTSSIRQVVDGIETIFPDVSRTDRLDRLSPSTS